MLTNLSANHEDTRIILNRGLTVDPGKKDGLALRHKGDKCLIESIDSKQMVKNLCISQRYHPWDHFLTFTCNQKTHFGVSPIRNWIDSGRWKNFYNNFYILDDDEQLEITTSLFQSSAALMLRAWEEVFSLFLNYLRKSKSSPFKHLTTIFSRKEYQKDKGNLSHSHMMIRLNWDVMLADERKFVDNIIRASVCDIIRADEIEKYIDHGLMKSHHDVFEVMEDATMFLSHKCSDRCLVKTLDGNLRCRKLDNLKVSKDNTRHEFMSLRNFFLWNVQEYWIRLVLWKKLRLIQMKILKYSRVLCLSFIQSDIYHQQILPMT